MAELASLCDNSCLSVGSLLCDPLQAPGQVRITRLLLLSDVLQGRLTAELMCFEMPQDSTVGSEQ